MSFHLLRFSVSHNPSSLLRARKLQLKLSQSGAQLRLSGDLRGKEGTRLDVNPGAKSTSCLHTQQNYCINLFDKTQQLLQWFIRLQLAVDVILLSDSASNKQCWFNRELNVETDPRFALWCASICQFFHFFMIKLLHDTCRTNTYDSAFWVNPTYLETKQVRSSTIFRFVIFVSLC